MTTTKPRIREIVKLGASKVSGYTRRWMLQDEHGTFEDQAMDLLSSTQDKAIALGLTESQVDNQIAAYLALQATEAQIKRQSK